MYVIALHISRLFSLILPSLVVYISMYLLYRLKSDRFGLRWFPMFFTIAIGLHYWVVATILEYQTKLGRNSLLLSILVSIVYFLKKEKNRNIETQQNPKRYIRKLLISGVFNLLAIITLSILLLPFSFGEDKNSTPGRDVIRVFDHEEKSFNSKDDVISYLKENYYGTNEYDWDNIKRTIVEKQLFYRKAYIVEFFDSNDRDGVKVRMYILSDGHVQVIKSHKYV